MRVVSNNTQDGTEVRVRLDPLTSMLERNLILAALKQCCYKETICGEVNDADTEEMYGIFNFREGTTPPEAVSCFVAAAKEIASSNGLQLKLEVGQVI